MLPADKNSGAGKAPHPCGGGKFLPGTRLRSFFYLVNGEKWEL